MKTQRLVAVIAMLALALGLPIADATPSFAATRLSVSPPNPVAREYITIAGRFGTAIQRPVQLQFKTSSGWKTLATKTTAATGKFAFKTRAVAPSRTFRVLAPRFKKNGRIYGSQTSATRTVRTVTATAVLNLVPAKIGQSMSGTPDLMPGTATFKPVRKGRGVKVQRRLASGSWTTVAEGGQNGRGIFEFVASAAGGQEFRALTVAKNGAPPKMSAKQAARFPAPDFDDNFNSFDTSKWEVRQPGSRNVAGGRQCSQSSSRSVSVNANGALVLQTIRITPDRADDPLTPLVDETYDNPDYDSNADCAYGQYYNGHIGTEKKFDFHRGIMAARIKMQPQRGHHGGFWSQPSGDGGAEIDVVEYYGDNYPNAILQHGIYQGDVKPQVRKNRDYLLRAGEEWSSGYHVFSVEWTSTQYIFRIDGHETYRTNKGLSQANQYLILSLLASQWELKLASEANQLPSSNAWGPMYVDWVRVWER